MSKIIGNEPIAATTMRQIGDNEFRAATWKDLNEGLYLSHQPGLTIRQHFAAMAMQGYCGGEYIGQSGVPHQSIAQWCVGMADALIAELNKPQP